MTDQTSLLETLCGEVGERQLLQAFINLVGDDLLLLDATRTIRYCTAGAATVFGLTPQDLRGRKFCDFIADEDQLGKIGPGATPFPPVFSREAGISYPVDGTLTPLTGVAGEVLGYLCRVRSITSATQESDRRVREESNHRMRNNLAMVCALLDMEVMQAPASERHRLRVTLARTRILAQVHNLVRDASCQIDLAHLVQSVVDGVKSLFGGGDHIVAITNSSTASISAKRATYLGLALTEITMHFLYCAQVHEQRMQFAMTVSSSATTADITITGSPCLHDKRCCLLSTLSREILAGMVERSLRGTLQLSEGERLEIQMRVPLDTAVTSHCE